MEYLISFHFSRWLLLLEIGLDAFDSHRKHNLMKCDYWEWIVAYCEAIRMRYAIIGAKEKNDELDLIRNYVRGLRFTTSARPHRIAAYPNALPIPQNLFFFWKANIYFRFHFDFLKLLVSFLEQNEAKLITFFVNWREK